MNALRTVIAVGDKKELNALIEFPDDVYKNDPHYAPQLFLAQRDMLTPSKHPFHEHSKVQLFSLYDNQQVIGRIAAMRNNNHNALHQRLDGFFGFFECINDQAAADQL